MAQHGEARRMVARAGKGLAGKVRAPGDKSISHRALMFGALAVGETRIDGLLTGEDVLSTAAALRQLGAAVARDDDGTWRVQGVGVGGFTEPPDVLDMGNSGTSARLLTGLLASHDFTSFMTGDASLRRRPMQRVTDPLSRMGAQFVFRKGGRLPMAVQGAATPVPIEYTLPVASAQVKSAILLAGLNTAGETTVIEPHPTRDHTERMLRSFGAEIAVRELDGGARAATVRGYPELRAQHIVVPGDPSSAAFAVVAGAVVPGSDLLVENVGLNPLRAGLYTTLKEMGADLEFLNRREVGGEPVADIRVRGSKLLGVEVPPARAPSMIDEYPILSVAASFALGPTRMLGIGELRAKESDRVASVAAGLQACGVEVDVGPEHMIVQGRDGPPRGGGTVATHLDHRIAMSFLVMGMACEKPVAIDDAGAIDTSFPGFAGLMRSLGADLQDAA